MACAILCVLVGILLLVCPSAAQFGFRNLPDSFYSSSAFQNAAANPYDDFTNASKADENELAFVSKQLTPSIVYIREDLWANGDMGYTYTRFDMFGVGSMWQMVTGQPALYIDLRRLPNISPTVEELKAMGVIFENNGTVTFTLTYSSEINDVEVIHAHGILGGWWTDGVPYLNTPLIQRDEQQSLSYNIQPSTNSGTYFMHSHFGFNALHGVSAPLIIQYPVSAEHKYAVELNDGNTQEILFYVEDWCLQFTNADDALNPNGDDNADFEPHFDPALCQNPYLTMRALYGEWNSDKGAAFLGNSATNTPPPGEGVLHTCQNGTVAPEFSSAFFLVNDRTYNDAYMQYVYPNSKARLRVINGARMSNFLLKVPQELDPIVIALDGSYVKPLNMSQMLPKAYQIWVGIAQRVDILLSIPVEEGSWNIVALQEMPDAETSNLEKFAPFEVSLNGGITLYSTYYPPPNTGIAPNSTGTGMLSVHDHWIIDQERLFQPWPDSAALRLDNPKQIQLALTGYNGIFGMNFQRGLEFPPMRSMKDFLTFFHQMPPLVTVQPDDLVCINMTNYNWDTHPMHLHGHKFQVRSIDGIDFNGPIRDTVMVPAGGCHSVNICFQATQSAGAFGLHCHMVIHEMAGMFTYIQYGEGVGLQGIEEAVTPAEPACPSETSRPVVVMGVAMGIILGGALLISICLNVSLYRRLNPGKTSEHVAMTSSDANVIDPDADVDTEEMTTYRK